jgi:hypothetical protein
MLNTANLLGTDLSKATAFTFCTIFLAQFQEITV